MEKRKEKKSFTLCWSLGMLGGIILGVIMDKLTVGIALGNMFGVMYYLFFNESDKSQQNDEE